MLTRKSRFNKSKLEELEALLKDCTVRVHGTGSSAGTGFFIDAHLVLTCAHVAKGNADDGVTLRAQSGDAIPGKILRVFHERVVDLALIEIAEANCNPDQPAVVLTNAYEAKDDLLHWGYPKAELNEPGGLEFRNYSANARINDDNRNDRWIIHSGGQQITKGQSGGALLSCHSGAVVGLMQFAASPDDHQNAGGGGISIARAKEHFEEVQSCITAPPPATGRWRDIFGQVEWESKGWTWRNEDVLDLYISGDPSSWKVSFKPGDEHSDPIRGSALPENISEALFAWAQSKKLKQKEDIKLLGSLLGAALFPKHVMDKLARTLSSDLLLVRLHFEKQSALIDVPWEFASVDIRGGVDIGTERQVCFVRTASAPRPKPIDTRPPDPGDDPARILSITMAPDSWHSSMPKSPTSAPDAAWPEPGEMQVQLRDAVGACKRHRLQTMLNPRLSEFEEELEHPNNCADIVHYTGFGTFEDGRAKIAFSDGAGGVQLRRLDDIFDETFARTQPRLLVLHFLTPPADQGFEPIPSTAFRGAINGNLNAVAYTRSFVYPLQSNMFNKSFYRSLGRGDTAETAVQSARRILERDRPEDDRACFGAFALLTGVLPRMRFGAPEDAHTKEASSGRNRGHAAPSLDQPHLNERNYRERGSSNATTDKIS